MDSSATKSENAVKKGENLYDSVNVCNTKEFNVCNDVACEIVSQIIEMACNESIGAGDIKSENILDVRPNEMDEKNCKNKEDESISHVTSEIISDDVATESVAQIIETTGNSENDSGDKQSENAIEVSGDETVTREIEIVATEDTVSEIVLDVCKDETSEIIAQESETVNTETEIKNEIGVDKAIGVISNVVVSEIVSQKMETADKAASDSGNQPGEIASEVREIETNPLDREIKTIADFVDKTTELIKAMHSNEAIEVVSKVCKEETSQEIGQEIDTITAVEAATEVNEEICGEITSGDVSSEIISEEAANESVSQIFASKGEAIEIVPQTIETTQKISEVQSSGEQIVPENNSELATQSSTLCAYPSDASLIVESIEEVKVKGDGNPPTKDESVVEIVTAGTSDKKIPSTKLMPQPSATVGKSDQKTVDQIPGSDKRKVVKGISVRTKELPGVPLSQTFYTDHVQEFYSNEILRRKRYVTHSNGNIRRVKNLNFNATGEPSDECRIYCSGLPYDITVNELVPFFERCGQISELHMTVNMGIVHVTYTTEGYAKNAIKTLNAQNLRGVVVRVEPASLKFRLFFRPISIDAKKSDLFERFSRLTSGLVKLYVPYSLVNNKQNRGHCYLHYVDNESAMKAKQILSKLEHEGQKVECDWATPSRTEKNIRFHKIFMYNLRPGIRTSDLRTIFSMFGEVTEIDKSENAASVKFRLPDGARAAFENVDKRMLGNEDVTITIFPREGNSQTTDDHVAAPKDRDSAMNVARNVRPGNLHASQSENSHPTFGTRERRNSPKLGARPVYDHSNVNISPKLGTRDRYDNYSKNSSPSIGQGNFNLNEKSSPNRNSRERYVDHSKSTISKFGTRENYGHYNENLSPKLGPRERYERLNENMTPTIGNSQRNFNNNNENSSREQRPGERYDHRNERSSATYGSRSGERYGNYNDRYSDRKGDTTPTTPKCPATERYGNRPNVTPAIPNTFTRNDVLTPTTNPFGAVGDKPGNADRSVDQIFFLKK